jgi:hypothetical protein
MRRNIFGIAALIIGIIGITGHFIGFNELSSDAATGFAVAGILAVCFGVAILFIRELPNTLAIVAILLGSLTFYSWATTVEVSDKNLEGEAVNTQSNTSRNKTASFGEKIIIDGVEYIVYGMEFKKKVTDSSGYFYSTADGEYLLLDIAVTNNSTSPITISASDFRLEDEGGATYGACIPFAEDNMLNYETLNPHASKRGYIAYDVANSSLGYTFFVDGNDFLSNENVSIKLK